MVASNETWFFNQTGTEGWRFQVDANRIVGTTNFNADRRQEIVVTSAWGIGILAFDGTSLTALMLAPNGTRFGDWRFDSLRNSIEGFGDFNFDRRDDIVIRSDWGMGILALDDKTLRSLMVAPYGTRFGTWTLKRTDRIAGVSQFSGTYDDQILILSQSGMALLSSHTYSGSALIAITHVNNGQNIEADTTNTASGSWVLNTKHNSIAGSGSLSQLFGGDVIIRSPWGIGILKYRGGRPEMSMLAPTGTLFPTKIPLDGWRYNSAADQILGVGDFSGSFGGFSDILVRSGWGIGIIRFDRSTSTLQSVMLVPYGTAFTGASTSWIFDPTDRIGIDTDVGAQTVPTWVSGVAQ